MFDELEKYKENDHFFFKATDDLEQVCNAPTQSSGVFIIYALKNGRIDLLYIGRSGKKMPNGELLIRETGPGGMKDSIVNGKQFGVARKVAWKKRMLKEKIEALDIYWYVTHNRVQAHCPKQLKMILLRKYLDLYGELPAWNQQ